MGPKLALIVDDSRSARAVLARMLERYRLEVDTAESAADALHYLATHRPDVIFMDHLMPGMDGLQALQLIKKDPRTATIPIMMYTSQEGELYLSQARALGAVGVLPKQTRLADVSKALEQLRLIEPGAAPADTRSPAAAAAAGESAAARLAALPPDLRKLIESLLDEHAIDLRRFVVERLDSNSERIIGELRLLLRDGGAGGGAAPLAVPHTAAAATPRRWLPWLAAVTAAMLALTVGVLWRQETAAQGELQRQLAAARVAAAAARSAEAAAEQQEQAVAATPRPPGPTIPGGTVLVDPVPYGEAPLAGARVDHVQALLGRLAAQGFRGDVQVLTFAGRYCLSGSGDGAAPAPDDTPVAKCESLSGVPDSAAPTTRESVVFANMLANARRASGGAFDVQVLAGAADDVQQPYPAPSDTLTALQWNRAAAANNRIEVRLVPEPPSPAAAAAPPDRE